MIEKKRVTPPKRMTPALLAVAEDAYREATKHKSVVSDLEGPLLAIGDAVLDAYIKATKKGKKP